LPDPQKSIILDDATMKITIHPLGPDLHLSRVTLDRELALRLRTSFQAITAAADAFTDTFYNRLFTVAPAVRSMFPADMQAQKQKLLSMLVWIVDNLEQGEDLKVRIRELGLRHEGYGAKAAHYPVVADAMLAAMAEVSGASWNRDIEADWRTVLERICDVMLGRA
jgi:hemoglobin-like flavoprotein